MEADSHPSHETEGAEDLLLLQSALGEMEAAVRRTTKDNDSYLDASANEEDEQRMYGDAREYVEEIEAPTAPAASSIGYPVDQLPTEAGAAQQAEVDEALFAAVVDPSLVGYIEKEKSKFAKLVVSELEVLRQQVLGQDVRELIGAAVRQELQGRVEDVVRQEIGPLFKDEVHRFSLDIEAGKELFRAETQARCQSNAEVHARLSRDLASVRSQIEDVRLSLEKTILKETKEHGDEVSELRDILDTMWQQMRSQGDAPGGRTKQYFRTKNKNPDADNQFSYKECVGDQQDIETLYELVNESLGISSRVSTELELLKAASKKPQLSKKEPEVTTESKGVAELAQTVEELAHTFDARCNAMQVLLEANFDATNFQRSKPSQSSLENSGCDDGSPESTWKKSNSL